MSVWRWPIPTLLIIVAVGCAGDDSDPVFTADEVTTPTAAPTTPVIVPLTTVPPINPGRRNVVFDRLTVLEENVVEISGSDAVSTDPVTIDDAVAAFLTFESTPDGIFIATVPIDTPGNHTVCIATTCDTVDVAAATE